MPLSEADCTHNAIDLPLNFQYFCQEVAASFSKVDIYGTDSEISDRDSGL